MVQFAWRVAVRGVEEEQTVVVRCDNACARGVPVPEHFQQSCRRFRLDAAAASSVVVARELLGDCDVLTCRLVLCVMRVCGMLVCAGT